jgi:hypothetical protein
MGVVGQSTSPAAWYSAKGPGIHCIGWVGTIAGLNGCGEEKISCPHLTSNPNPAARSNSLYHLHSPDSQVLVQVPNIDFHWNVFGQHDEINQVAYPPNNIQILRITHIKYLKYSYLRHIPYFLRHAAFKIRYITANGGHRQTKVGTGY